MRGPALSGPSLLCRHGHTAELCSWLPWETYHSPTSSTTFLWHSPCRHDDSGLGVNNKISNEGKEKESQTSYESSIYFFRYFHVERPHLIQDLCGSIDVSFLTAAAENTHQRTLHTHTINGTHTHTETAVEGKLRNLVWEGASCLHLLQKVGGVKSVSILLEDLE